MARRAKIVMNERRQKIVAKQSSLRRELRAFIKNTKNSEEKRFEAQVKIQSLQRDGCENRVRNRCELTGRARGFYRKFKLSRITFRELALAGMIPGITKSSW